MDLIHFIGLMNMMILKMVLTMLRLLMLVKSMTLMIKLFRWDIS